jgi:hypothetical protein
LFFPLFSYVINGITMYNHGMPIIYRDSRFHRSLMEAGICFLANFVSVAPNCFLLLPCIAHFVFERYLVGMQ